MARLKTRMRRRRRRDYEESLLPKVERADWTHEWQQEMRMWDRMGFVVSLVCMAHCVTMPLLFAFAPTLQALFGHVNAHVWLAGITLFITFATFIPSFLQHRRWSVLALALTGLSIVSLTAISDGCCGVPLGNCVACQTGQMCPQPGHAAAMTGRVDRTPTSDRPDVGVRATDTFVSDLSLASLWSRWQTPFGGALLAVAHVLNARFRRRCCGACRGSPEHETEQLVCTT